MAPGRKDLHELRLRQWHESNDLRLREPALLGAGEVRSHVGRISLFVRYNEECGMGKECAEGEGVCYRPCSWACF